MKNEIEKEEIYNGVKIDIVRIGFIRSHPKNIDWNQQNLMQNKISPGQRALGIGFGSEFTANYLRLRRSMWLL